MESIIKIVKEVLCGGIQENIAWVVLTLICVSMLYLINSLLGLAIAWFKSDVDWKKFLLSQARNLIVVLCILAACYALNITVATISLISGLTIEAEVATAIEVIAIVVAWCVDLGKDIVEKLKSFKTLKFVSYDDIKVESNEIENLRG